MGTAVNLAFDVGNQNPVCPTLKHAVKTAFILNAVKLCAVLSLFVSWIVWKNINGLQ